MTSSDDAETEILLGVTGSIACYKACDITSELTQAGRGVHVVLTETAARMVSPHTFETLSQRDVFVNLFADSEERQPAHIDLADRVDLVLVAPATANMIGKVANGIADDLLTSLIMAVGNRVPVLFAPAMNSNMFENPLFQENLQTLKGHGYRFVEPDEGYMACGDLGKGRLADVQKILDQVEVLL